MNAQCLPHGFALLLLLLRLFNHDSGSLLIHYILIIESFNDLKKVMNIHYYKKSVSYFSIILLKSSICYWLSHPPPNVNLQQILIPTIYYSISVYPGA